MVSKRLKTLSFINFIAALILFVIFIALYIVNIWDQKLLVIGFVVLTVYLAFSLASYFVTSLFPVLPFVLNLMFAILMIAGRQSIKLNVFLFTPVLLAMYYGSKQLTKAVIGFNILCYFFVPLWYSIFTVKNPMPQLIVLPVVATLPYSFEILAVVIMAKRFLIDSEQVKKENELYSTITRDAFNNTIMTYTTIVKARSYLLGKHIDNVATYTDVILGELEKNDNYKKIITPEYKKAVIKGAYLHEIGTIDFDKSLMEKFTNYTEEETALLNSCPEKSIEIFDSFMPGTFTDDEKEVIRNILLQHKEYLNGTGEPKHLIGRQISLEAQIIAVADYLDSGLIYQPNVPDRNFNAVYMDFITKGYDKFNQEIVNILYEKRTEIMEYSKSCNSDIEKHYKKNAAEL